MPRQQATPTVVHRSPPDLRWLRKREVWGAVLGLFSLLSALALLSVIRGALGTGLVRFLRGLFGWGAYPVVAMTLAAAAWLLARERLAARISVRASRALGAELFLLACLGLLHLPFATLEGYLLAERGGGGGGYVGWTLVYLLSRIFGRLLGGLLLAVVAVAGSALAFDVSWSLLRDLGDHLVAALDRRLAPPAPPPAEGPRVERPAPALPVQQPKIRPAVTSPGRAASTPPASPAPAATARRRARSLRLPSLDLLSPASPLAEDDAETRYQAQVIEETLAHFGVPAVVADVQRGPAVTQFGLEPGFIERKAANGTTLRRKVRVNRIVALSNDLALALALAVPSLRIEAPLPGRPLVGIEVPNRKPSMVNLRSVMESDVFQRIRSPLRLALGQGVSGRPAAADLASMPHLLIAGATGSGKSVCINALIACLLLENPPEALQLVLVDPKRVELTSFDGVPHLIGRVIVDVEQTVAALRWLCQEMEQRYRLFAGLKVRHIEGHNAAVGRRKGQRLPFVVVFIDELADLMMVAPEEVERSVCRLAQMGRATGIHLVVATQRPSVDVLTGLIKANFPARIAFALTTQVDSRVILDCAGAEQLLGRGDMLFMSPDANRLLRLQGCFVSDAELAAVTGYWREAVEDGGDQEDTSPPWDSISAEDSEEDPLLSQALELIGRQSQTSTSFLQRRLRIGYSRAARLMEQLEAQGVVGPDPGGGRRRQLFVSTVDEGVPDQTEDDGEAT